LEESLDFSKLQEEAKKKKAVETALNQYSQCYLERRNKIMLILKYGISPIFDLQALPINQNLYAFLMCKKAFLDISEFKKAVNGRANIFKITTYLAEFGASKEYVGIIEQINNDYDMIGAYANSFILEVATKNPKVKAELTLESVTPDFPQILKEELNSYSYQLYDQRNNTKVRRQNVIRLMTFVADLANGINMSSEQYDRRIESLDYNLMEKEFGKKMQALYGK